MDTAVDLAGTLLALERGLLRPEIRRSRAALEQLLAPDFLEIGRSGRVYDRGAIVRLLADEPSSSPGPAHARIEGFAVRRLAAGVALATYRTVGAAPDGTPAVVRRASIWCLDADGSWRMTFHQGTPATGVEERS